MKFVSLLAFCIVNSICFSQDNEKVKSELHVCNNHFEIGLAVSPSHSDSSLNSGCFMHFTQIIKHFELGVGAGTYIENGPHYGLSAVFSYHPIHEVILSLTPGFTLYSKRLEFMNHFEASYAFELRHFHFGPLADFEWTPSEQHLMFGAHMDIVFK